MAPKKRRGAGRKEKATRAPSGTRKNEPRETEMLSPTEPSARGHASGDSPARWGEGLVAAANLAAPMCRALAAISRSSAALLLRLLACCARLLVARGTALMKQLWEIDWRLLAAHAHLFAAWLAGGLLEALGRAPRLALGILTAVKRLAGATASLARALALAALTLCMSILFLGAVLLGTGRGEPTPDALLPWEERLMTRLGSEREELRGQAHHEPKETGGELSEEPHIDAPASTPAPGPLAEGRDSPRATGASGDEPVMAKELASCSAGTRVTGPLLNPARLPDEGEGFRRVFPHRDLSWGTDELVGAIERAAATLYDADLPPLVVGNLSGPKGDQAGADAFHPARYARGQGAGRAGDLLFFSRDSLGRPAEAVDSSIAFDSGGRSLAGSRRIYIDARDPIPAGCHLSRTRGEVREVACPMPPGAWTIDFDRTWLLVRALLTDPVIGAVDPQTGIVRPDGSGIRFMFVAEGIKRRLLAAGRAANEPEELMQIASILLHPPSNAPAFDRFIRLDLWCTDQDRAGCGCDDGSGPWNRWPAGARIDLEPSAERGRVAAISRAGREPKHPGAED